MLLDVLWKYNFQWNKSNNIISQGCQFYVGEAHFLITVETLTRKWPRLCLSVPLLLLVMQACLHAFSYKCIVWECPALPCPAFPCLTSKTSDLDYQGLNNEQMSRCVRCVRVLKPDSVQNCESPGPELSSVSSVFAEMRSYRDRDISHARMCSCLISPAISHQSATCTQFAFKSTHQGRT